jgi:hypothetical protein
MYDKMRWYLIAFWIFLTPSVFHFALAAPVGVGYILEARSNPVKVLNGGIAAWERRMDFDSNHPVDGPDVDEKGVNTEGVKEKRMWGWGWEWELPNSKDSEWDSTNGLDGFRNNPPNNHAIQNSQGSAVNMRPSPQSEHPTTPGLVTFLENWFKEGGRGGPKVFRPRNSGSGAVDTPKSELQ